MKIVSYNINGIRASVKLGLLEWIDEFDADIVCLQEVRCSKNLTENIITNSNQQMDIFNKLGKKDKTLNYIPIYNCGNIAGYAGTLILTKVKPDEIFYDMGEFWKDDEGRTTTIVCGEYAIVNSYVPNGNSRLEFKMNYLKALNQYLSKLKDKYKVICAGDFNIAHNEIDITHPKEYKNKSVFLPIERESFSELLNIGMVDSFRYLHPEQIRYSWRSYRSRVDSNFNSCKFRIDYILVSENLKKELKSCDILDLEYSDHLAVYTKIES